MKNVPSILFTVKHKNLGDENDFHHRRHRKALLEKNIYKEFQKALVR